MKIITLENGNIKEFIDKIYESTKDGEPITISMYGYKAIVFGSSPKNAIRKGVLKKLKDIKNFEINLKLLKEHSELDAQEISTIASTHTPEELADLCLEYGLASNQTKRTI